MFSQKMAPDQTLKTAIKSKIKPTPALSQDDYGPGLQRYLGSRRSEHLATNQGNPGYAPPIGSIYGQDSLRPTEEEPQTPSYPSSTSTYPMPVSTDPPTEPAYPTPEVDSTPNSASDITSETVAPMPAPRSRTEIGVGEEVILTHRKKHVKWTTTAGILSGAIDNKVKFIAPDIPKKITISGNRSSITFDVIAPNGVFMERMNNSSVYHKQDRPDSGINVQVYIQPDTVNFYKVQYLEDKVGAVADGEYKSLAGIPHEERPNMIYLSDTVVSGKGTQVPDGGDCVYSGDPGTAPPFSQGSITYDIPYEYKVGGGRYYPFATITQKCTLDPDGSTLKASKANASGDTTVASPTIFNVQCPFNM